MRIAVCFFGIPRSLKFTLPSIEAHVLAPARAAGEVRLLAHLYRQDTIANPRSGEYGALDPADYGLIPYDRLETEPPEGIPEAAGFAALSLHGDPWDDGFASLRNLLLQLTSLKRVTALARAEAADLVVFCRPDLRYIDSWTPLFARATAMPGDNVLLPDWQAGRGVNDRFALVKGDRALAAYGERLDRAAAFCAAGPRPLHAEQLLRYSLETAGVTILTTPARARRIRFDGTPQPERFHRYSRYKLVTGLNRILAQVSGRNRA